MKYLAILLSPLWLIGFVLGLMFYVFLRGAIIGYSIITYKEQQRVNKIIMDEAQRTLND